MFRPRARVETWWTNVKMHVKIIDDEEVCCSMLRKADVEG